MANHLTDAATARGKQTRAWAKEVVAKLRELKAIADRKREQYPVVTARKVER